MGRKPKDITGQIFNDNIIALERVGLGNGSSIWKFECLYKGPECKGTFEATVANVKTMKSCGCYKRVKCREVKTKHGMFKTPEHRTWGRIIERCYNPDKDGYHRYGGRGIKVCNRWRGKDGFKNFYTDMGPKPGSDYSIERINNDGNYEPDNCKWILNNLQQRNQQNNKIKNLEEANFIRDLHKLGHSTKNLAIGIGCGETCIRRIVNNITWKM